MIMKQVNLLVFASLCFLASSAPQVYYITPTKPDPQGSCHVNGTTLRPCYTLQQLNGVLSSSNGSVEVLLLPGTHLIQLTLNVSHFSEVVIRPWKEELEIVIECYDDTLRHASIREWTPTRTLGYSLVSLSALATGRSYHFSQPLLIYSCESVWQE